MSTQSTTGEGQEPTGTGTPGQEPNPQQGQEPNTPPPPAGQEPGTGEGESTDPRVSSANAEAAKYRKALREAEAKVAELEKGQLSEQERVQRERDEARQAAEAATARADTVARRAAIVSAAAAAGAVDTDTVTALLLTGKGAELEVADDGTVAGAAELVAELLAAKPFLAAQAGAPPPPANGGANAPGAGDHREPSITRQTLEEMAARGEHTAIEKLRQDGKLDHLLGKTK